MRKELESFRQIDGKPYNLVPLPMPSPKYYKGERLPATYANFLITNETLIYPTYQVREDRLVKEIFKKLFPDRELIPIDCSRLITQGGSLHCSTMQIL